MQYNNYMNDITFQDLQLDARALLVDFGIADQHLQKLSRVLVTVDVNILLQQFYRLCGSALQQQDLQLTDLLLQHVRYLTTATCSTASINNTIAVINVFYQCDIPLAKYNSIIQSIGVICCKNMRFSLRKQRNIVLLHKLISLNLYIAAESYRAVQYQEALAGFDTVAKIMTTGIISDQDKNHYNSNSSSIIANSVQHIIGYFDAVNKQASAIVTGNYDVTIKPRSKNDILGLALSSITDTMRINSAEQWLKTAEAELANLLQGEQNIAMAAKKFITFVAKQIKAPIAILYIMHDDKNLKLTASYAFNNRQGVDYSFKAGEGVIGQVALEKELLVINDIPSDYYIKVNSSGKAVPKQLVAVPALFNDKLIAVLEIGLFSELDDIHQTFLHRAASIGAISINSGLDRNKTEVLLEKTKNQAEELQAQQERLRASNEELEEQTERLERQTMDIQSQNKKITQAKQELEAKAAELEKSGKYKSEFLANMSHELRTPLNSLLILAGLLADNPEKNLTADQIKSARIIRSGGEDLLNIINDILDLSKVEAGMLSVNFNNITIDNIVLNIQQQFMPEADKRKVEFKIDLADNLPDSINTDMQRISQILKNLLSNAFKFTDKGSVTLKISSLPNKITFAVIDTGMGIDPTKQELIFQAFQQSDGSINRVHGGTGLGLTISRELANLLGGKIYLQSKVGVGSTFSLCLPLQHIMKQKISKPLLKKSTIYTVPNFAIADDILDDRNDISGNDNTILIIEDDLKFNKVLVDIAQTQGYRCLSAIKGRTGLLLAEQYLPDAILLDLGLPDIDGIGVLEQLKFNLDTRHIPVHIISAQDEDPSIFQKGAVGYLVKPITAEQIEGMLDDLKRLLQRGVKEILVVEDDINSQEAIKQLIQNKNINMTFSGTAQKTYDLMQKKQFDCIILDLMLPDENGFTILNKLQDRHKILPPIIIYTGKELTKEEVSNLQQYASHIVVKGVNSPERLLDEVSLFLHSVKVKMPDTQQKMITMFHDKDALLNGHKVLLVDDDMRNIFALSKVMKKYGIKVIVADNGQSALDKLATEQGIDLVLMDIMMPVMDGYDAIRKIRKQEKFVELPIIALTAKVMLDDKAKCLEAGANDYLSKPVDVNKLLSLLRLWLFSGSVVMN